MNRKVISAATSAAGMKPSSTQTGRSKPPVRKGRCERVFSDAQEPYRLLAETVSDAVVSTDLKLRILSWNKAAETLYGWKAGEVLGRTFQKICPTVFLDGKNHSLKKVLAQKRWKGEWMQKRRDGTRIVVSAFLTGIRDRRGIASGMVAVCRNITEQKRGESLLKALNEAALATQKALSPHDVFTTVSSTLRKMDYHCTVFVLDDTQSILSTKHLSYKPKTLKTAERLVGVQASRFSISVSAAKEYKKAIQKRVPVFVEDSHEFMQRILPKSIRKFAPKIEKLLHVPRFIIAPLIFDDRVIGLLTVQSETLHETDTTAVGVFAHQLAGAWRRAEWYGQFQKEIVERKRTEEVLKRSSEEIRDLYNNAPCGYHSLDTNGVFIRINDTELKWLGYTREEVIGKIKFSDTLSPAGLKAHKKNFPRFKKSGWVKDVEYEMIRKDGTVLPVLLNATAIKDDRGRYVMSRATVFDMTGRKRSEEILKQESSFRNTVIRRAADGLAVCHAVSEYPFVAFTVWNNRMRNITGYTIEEINRLGWYQTMYPDPETRERAIERMSKMRKGDDILGEEWTITRADGEKRTLSISTSILDTGNGENHVLAMMQDITERKRSEEALLETKNRHQELMERARDTIFSLSLQGSLLSVNQAFERLTGWKVQEWIGKPFAGLLHPDDVLPAKERFSNVLKGQTSQALELRIRKKSGDYVHGEIIASPQMKNGTAIGLLGIGRDITERKRAEEALRASEDRFRMLFEESPLPTLLSEMPSGVIAFANKKFRDVLGLSADEIVGKRATDLGLLFDAGDQESLTSMLLAKGSIDDLEVKSITPANTIGINLISMRLVVIQGKSCGLVVIQDITDRKRAEQALQKSELQYRTTIDSMGDSIHVVDKALRFVLVNEAFKAWNRSLGLEPDGVGCNLFDVFSFLPNRVRKEYDQVFTTGKTLFTEESTHFGGKTFVTETRKIPILGGGRVDRVVTVIRDITQRKQAEEQLRQSEAELRKAQHFAHVGSWTWNIQANRLQWSDEMYRIFGLKKEEFSGSLEEVIARSIHPEDRKKVEASNLSVVQKKKPVPVEYRVVWPDQSIHTVWAEAGELIEDEAGNPVLLSGIVQDITERKQAEEALRESEEKYRYLVERSNDGFAIIQDGKFIFANNRIPQLLGCSLVDVLGVPFDRYIAPEERDLVKDRYLRRLSGEHVPNQYMTKAITLDGKRIDIELNVDFIQYQSKPALFVMIRDITERKKAQELMENAQKSYRLASLGTLAAGISHEINQPLTALKVKVDGMLYWGTAQPDLLQKNLAQNLQFISDEADKIDRIIQHMRSLIRREKCPPVPVDINDVIQKALSISGQQLASHGIYLRLKLDKKQPCVLAQEVQIEEVVINLISNAVRALDKMDQEQKMVWITTKTAGDSCLIEVEDNGPGIPEDHLHRIFDPFFSTEAEEKGLGLGLPIVKHLLEEFDGTIDATNRAESGAVFTVTLPLFSPDPEEAS